MSDISKLTDKQKACLRLVAQGYNTKHIARQLDVSAHSVDQRIRNALRILGVDDRFSAARLLAQAEADPTYQRLIYQPEDLQTSADVDIVELPATEAVPSSPFRVPPVGGSSNDLSTIEKAKRIAAVATLIGGSILSLLVAWLWLMPYLH